MADVAVERRREQHRLSATRAVAQDPLDLWREPVVGHAVGLVEDDDVDVGERDVVRLEQVDQPQRRGHDDLDTFLQGLDLVVAAGPAVHGEHPLTGMLGDRCEHLGDLHGELPRWVRAPPRAGRRNSTGSRIRDSIGTPNASVLPDPVRARPHDVVTLDGDGNRRRLDLERFGEARGGEAVVDVGGTPSSAKPVGGSTGGRVVAVVSVVVRGASFRSEGRQDRTAPATGAPRRGDVSVMIRPG